MSVELTEAEARVLFTMLANAWAPSSAYAEFQSAVKKLCQMGGGYCCRDCSEKGTNSSRYGGFVCPKHYAQEKERQQNG